MQNLLSRVAHNRRHILVVDDVKANRDVAGALLASLGHDIAFAAGGAEALEKLPTEAFDLVLMDLQMPQMDGFEAARAIRAMPDPLGKVPIFALTASVMPDQIAAAQAAGMNGHIGKPLTREALATALSDVRTHPANEAQSQETCAEASALPVASVVDQRVLDLLKSELKGAAAGVFREFMVEMQTIRDQFAAELGQAAPRADMIAQNAHRLLGAARTLGAMQLAEQVAAFQQLQPRNSSVFQMQNIPALKSIIAETDIALKHLEAFFDEALIGERA
jgi:CheY-like chemotaxis protein